MKIQNFRIVPAAETTSVPKDARWIDDALGPRDKALKDHTEALQSRLSFSDNFNAEVRSVSLHHQAEVELTLTKLHGEPLGIVLLHNAINDYTRTTWRQTDVSTVAVKVDFSTAPTAEVDVTLLILGS